MCCACVLADLPNFSPLNGEIFAASHIFQTTSSFRHHTSALLALFENFCADSLDEFIRGDHNKTAFCIAITLPYTFTAHINSACAHRLLIFLTIFTRDDPTYGQHLTQLLLKQPRSLPKDFGSISHSLNIFVIGFIRITGFNSDFRRATSLGQSTLSPDLPFVLPYLRRSPDSLLP
ncbi:hypothetical protein BV898_05370 [Hypsibius exemplaris]|uniref:Uncharacterized protein n=1 Tax=Hypsibius exemplaris TaxID=2072580 RepID=A0A1W0WZF2_HYPEX|nr:hypothetical protein BV898_05370 [Hypsibius exemplaris]